MTDPELVEKKLAEIETYLRELRSLAEPDRIRSDDSATWRDSGTCWCTDTQPSTSM